MEQNENQDSIRERIRAYAFDLKLPLVRRDIDLLIQQGLDERWNLWMFTAELLRQEKENRSENQRRHRIKNAAFPQLRYLNEIDTDALPPEARKALPNLETLDFIKEGRNLILYGNPGTGKTHLATALGIAACNAGYSVLFTSVPRLLTQIRECRNAMTLRALENKFERYDMVICDEFGYVSCDKAGAEMLFNHLSLRTDKKTTVITTNLAFNRWDEIIADKVLVTAMVDRLTHKAILLNMTGKSYRMKETQDMINKQISLTLQNLSGGTRFKCYPGPFSSVSYSVTSWAAYQFLYVAPPREAIPTEAIHTTEETQVIHSVLTFDQQPLQEIVRQLSETFRTDIRIEGDSLKNYHMTATFREGESLTEILDLLKDAGNFTYKKENNTIILTTKLN